MADAREIARTFMSTREWCPPDTDLDYAVVTLEAVLREYAVRILDDLASQAEIAADYADARRSARETWLEVRDDLRRRAEEERRGD